jgi:DNA gyrase/topoisomerase IV subunit A
VAAFAKKLRDDMDKQERVLNVFITTIKQKHQQSTLKLSRVKAILKGLKDEIANATKYANTYEAEVSTQSGQGKIIQDEWEKSHKMYSDERATIEFEKKFLEEIIKYIQLRRSNCLTK